MNQLPTIPGLIVLKKIAEGGQGSVYLVHRSNKEYALKLYHDHCATTAQRTIIKHLVQSGVPAGGYENKFAWPLELIEVPGGATFGYLMRLIDTKAFITLAKIESGRVPHPGYGIMAEAGRQLAELFRELHIAGYCYGDISKYNFMFSARTGDVIICDNDNIVVNRQGQSSVIGTPQYIAPELVLGTDKPSTMTDQHALAVLLFVLICGGHPFHGNREFNIKIFDAVASHQIYGTQPVFVFDPHNRSNRLPDAPGYRHVAERWEVLPLAIQKLFIRTFTDGLKDPSKRVIDIDWANALSQLLSQRKLCTCGAENFWDPDRRKQKACWHKGCTVDYPLKLYIQGKSTTAVLIESGQHITSLHLGEKSSSSIIAEVENHPSDKSRHLLRNKTSETWTASLNEQRIEVSQDRAIPLHPGLQIKTRRAEFSVHP